MRFLGDEFEGRETWVPPSRLKVLWSEVAEYRAWEERWRRIHQTGLGLDDLRGDAAEEVIRVLLPDSVRLGCREGGAIRIADPEGLAGRLGLQTQQLTEHPDAFVEEGVLVAPWEVTELVVRGAARINPGPILRLVRAEERQAQYDAIHGRVSGSRGHESYSRPEESLEFDEEYMRPRREVLRSWCGAVAVGRFDELIELREEVARLGGLVRDAIAVLRKAGSREEASRLQRALDTPVEMLRPHARE